MKSTCINHPAREPLIIVRQWQLEFCEGNTVAAALLSFFEYWHNIKLENQSQNQKLVKVANAHGEEIEIDMSLYQWHTNDDLSAGIMDIARSKNTINKAIDLLEEKGAISIHPNPNPKYKFDKTRYFRFYPETCNQWLNSRTVNFDPSSVKNDDGSVNIDGGVVTFDGTITETTTEITTESKDQTHKKQKLDPVLHLVEAAKSGVSEITASYPKDSVWGWRDAFMKIWQDRFGYPDDSKKGVISELSAEPDSDPETWDLACRESSINWTGNGKPSLTRVIDVYRAGGTWAAWKLQTYGQPENGKESTYVTHSEDGGFYA